MEELCREMVEADVKLVEKGDLHVVSATESADGERHRR